MTSPIVSIPGSPAVSFGVPGLANAASIPDPMADRSRTLLAKLKRDVNQKRRAMPAILAVESLKGLKTVCSLAVPLKAGTSAKGTPIFETPGIPVPDGPISVLGYDHQTEGSLEGYYGTTQPAVSKVLEDPEGIVPIRRLLGYNSGQPQTALDVIDGTRAQLKDWAQPGRQRALLVIDRCDLYVEDILKKGCFAKAKKPLDAQMDKGDWTPRSNWVEEFIDLCIGATMDGGLIILTGPPMKDEGREKLVNLNGKWVIGTQPSKWVDRLQHHLNAFVTGTVGEDQHTRNVVRFLECDYSRIPWLPERVRVPINGRHLGAFLQKELHIPMEKDDGPQILSPSAPVISFR
jgi:hypothetical protein